MGQDWYIFSMDHREILNCIGNLDEFLFNAEADCLVDLLAVPLKPSLQPSVATNPMYDSPTGGHLPPKPNLEPMMQIQSHLTALPDELLLVVFHNLGLVSSFHLSLVSQRLWNVGWSAVQLKVAKLMGPWAGARIICMGDYCKPNDVPAGFLTAAEEAEVNEGLNKDDVNKVLDEDEIYPPEEPIAGPGDLLNLAICRFRECTSKVEPHRMLLDCETDHLPSSISSQIYEFAQGRKVTEYYPETESWILRNLTAQEFVRGDKLFAAFPRSEGNGRLHLGYPGFGEAIMCRICRSPSDFFVPATGLAINRGVWAGHRFEICTEKHHALHSNGSWKDATSEIIREVSGLLMLETLDEESFAW